MDLQKYLSQLEVILLVRDS